MIAKSNLKRYGGNLDELRSSCYMGLVAAARNWDPTRATATFKTFASMRIQGMIKDDLRSQFGRSDKPSGRAKREAVRVPLETELIKEDKNEALADYSDIPEDVVEKTEREDHIKRLLQYAIGTLPVREQKMLRMYYFENVSLARIALALDISESRVSQIVKRALARIKPIVAEGMA